MYPLLRVQNNCITLTFLCQPLANIFTEKNTSLPKSVYSPFFKGLTILHHRCKNAPVKQTSALLLQSTCLCVFLNKIELVGIYQVGVLSDPLFSCDRNVESIDAQCNNCQQSPKKTAAEQLPTGAVKLKTVTVQIGVALLPSQQHANNPRSSDAKSNNDQKSCEETSTNVPPKTTCKLRTHNKIPFLKIVSAIARTPYFTTFALFCQSLEFNFWGNYFAFFLQKRLFFLYLSLRGSYAQLYLIIK